MSYATTIAALVDKLETLSSPPPVLKYAPTAVHTTPVITVFFGSAERVDAGQVTGIRYAIVIRLILAWQDFEAAENQLEPYVDSIPALLRADRHLGLTGASAPLVQIEEMTIEGGWIEIAGVTYRTVDFTVPILEKQVG